MWITFIEESGYPGDNSYWEIAANAWLEIYLLDNVKHVELHHCIQCRCIYYPLFEELPGGKCQNCEDRRKVSNGRRL